MLEKSIEVYGKKQFEKLGGWVIKLGMLGGRGWPDHTIFLKGRIVFIEYKRPGGAFQPGQKAIHRKLGQYGFQVHIV
ncbi:MAG TPA: VRR-NUC domain-containing protein, partial [Planctomycetes bacterium]|nr:VRR-NUC domain-containing protein [Planctomycetota bacterium]